MDVARELLPETDPALSSVLAELIAREPLFHRAEFGTTRADFERMIVDDYWEVGASGRRYGRAFVLDTLERRHAVLHDDPWRTSDLRCRALSADTYLLTYTLQQAQRLTRRATLWRRDGGNWRAVYHQGTLAEADGST